MADKQFNYRLATWLIASLVLGAAAVHLVHIYQLKRHARTLQEQANRADAAGQTEQAAVLLKRYLLFAPDDTTALLRYGEMLEKSPALPANRWLATAAYKQVLARSPSLLAVREHLIALLLDLAAYPDAREQIEIQLQALPKDGRLEALLALCLEEEGDYRHALSACEKAVEHDPTQIACYTRQAALLYTHFNQPEDADAVMDKLVAANDKNFAAYLDRCLYRMGLGRLDDAAKDLSQARTLAHRDPRVLVTAAELAYQRGRIGDARAAWQEGLNEHPETLNMYLGLATLEIADQRPREAVACVQRGLQRFPGNTDLLHLLTEAYLAQNDVTAAEAVAARVRRDNAGTGVADYLQALILRHRGYWADAIPTLEKALALQDLPNPLASRMYVYLAECYERLGDNDRRLAAYQRALLLEPAHLPANLGLAMALLAAGKSEEALSRYRQMARMTRPPADVWLLLGRTLLRHNQALPPKKRSWDEIERALQRADGNEALLVPTAILRTDVLLVRGKPDEARKTLEQARERKPDEPALWTALAKLMAQRGNRSGAESILSEARKQLGDRFAFRITALELGIGQDDRDAKMKLLAYEKDLVPFTSEEQLRLLATLASLHFRLGFSSEGERLTRELAARQPLDLPAAIIVLDLALQLGEEGLLTRLIADLHRLEGDDGTWWRYGEAQRQLLQLQHGDANAANEAQRLVVEIAKRRPNWSRAALLEAELCELHQDALGAVKAYTRAFEQGERRYWMVYRLMNLLVAVGRPAEADEVMNKAQQQVLPQGAFARFAAETALRIGRYDRAVSLGRLAVPGDSRDPRDFIWLGQLLATAERAAEAEETLRRAVALRDNLLDTWVALIAFYANSDQVSEAEDAMRIMADKLTPTRLPLALALCEQALGREELAEQHFLEARALRPNDELTLQRLAAFYVWLNQPRKAEPALQALFDPTLRLSPDVVPWARRQLALLRADRGDESGYCDALALLKTNGNGSLADARATAFVKASRGRDQRTAAVLTIEETAKIQPLTPDEQFRLARLYEAEDDWSIASEQFVALLNVERHNPEYLAYFVAALSQRERKVEARTYLAKLAKLEPDSARVKKFREELK